MSEMRAKIFEEAARLCQKVTEANAAAHGMDQASGEQCVLVLRFMANHERGLDDDDNE